MIRIFLNFCKCFFKINKINEYQILQVLEDSIYDNLSACPTCGAPATAFHKDGDYERDFICYEEGTPVFHKIVIHCMECSSCGHSHALEPSVIVPYSSYSMGFLLHIIRAKIIGRFSTVLELCEHFQISISSYYRILKKYMLDSFLLEKLIDDMLSIINPEHYHLPNFHQSLRVFFLSNGYSFLQPCVRLYKNIQMKQLLATLSRYIGNG